MSTLQQLLVLAGAFHFCLLPLTLQVPQLLRYREELPKMHPFNAQVFKAYGAFIVLSIVAFGLLTLLAARQMAEGETLAVALAAFIATFWTMRLCAALFYYRPQELLNSRLRHVGYRLLTVLFAYWATVYWTAVIHGLVG